LINISNIFGDDYDEFIPTESILFEVLEISPSNMLNFEIKNGNSLNGHVVVMFSECTENFDIFSNSNSLVMKIISPLIIFGLIIFGLIIFRLIIFRNNDFNNCNADGFEK